MRLAQKAAGAGGFRTFASVVCHSSSLLARLDLEASGFAPLLCALFNALPRDGFHLSVGSFGNDVQHAADRHQIQLRRAELNASALIRCTFESLYQVRQRCSQIVRDRSEEHTSELQSLLRISYAVFCLKNKNKPNHTHSHTII